MVRVEASIVERMERQSGMCTFVLRGASKPLQACRALERARRAVFKVPHPDEPDEPLPNYASDVTMTPDGPSFWLDCKDELDAPDVAAAVVAAMVRALKWSRTDGLLSVVRHDEM